MGVAAKVEKTFLVDPLASLVGQCLGGELGGCGGWGGGKERLENSEG
jgi:hypothetical protein